MLEEIRPTYHSVSARAGGYLRIGWERNVADFYLERVTLVSAETAEPSLQNARLRALDHAPPPSRGPGANANAPAPLYFDAGGPVPVAAATVRFVAGSGWLTADVAVGDSLDGPWSPVAYGALFYEVDYSGTRFASPAVAIGRTEKRYWRIAPAEPVGRDRVELELRYPQELLRAGQWFAVPARRRHADRRGRTGRHLRAVWGGSHRARRRFGPRSARSASSAAAPRSWCRSSSPGARPRSGSCSAPAWLPWRSWRLDSLARCTTNRPEVLRLTKPAKLRRSFAGIAARAFAAALLAGLLLSALPVLALRWLAPPVTAMMLEQPGPAGDLDYEWVDRASISVAAARAVIAAEDQRFFEHHGLDFQVDRARARRARERGTISAASTITQQVAKNVFPSAGTSCAQSPRGVLRAADRGAAASSADPRDLPERG
jgi:hypothetical protein